MQVPPPTPPPYSTEEYPYAVVRRAGRWTYGIEVHPNPYSICSDPMWGIPHVIGEQRAIKKAKRMLKKIVHDEKRRNEVTRVCPPES